MRAALAACPTTPFTLESTELVRSLSTRLDALWDSRVISPLFAMLYPDFTSCHSLREVISASMRHGAARFDPGLATPFLSTPSTSFYSRVASDNLAVATHGLVPTLHQHMTALANSRTIITATAISTFAPFSPNLARLSSVALGVDLSIGMRDPTSGQLPPPILRDAADIASEPAVLHHLLHLYESGKCLLLRRDLFMAEAAAHHYYVSICRAFVVWKALKPVGRLITDYRDNGVNGPSTTQAQALRSSAAAIALGPIHNATTADICHLLTLCAAIYGGAAHVHAEVKDASSAFMRAPISIASALLTAIALTIAGIPYVAIPFVCLFGHYYSGFAWGAIASELQRQTNARGRAAGVPFDCCLTIVDDFLSIGPHDFILHDHAPALANGLAGDDAFANDKYQTTINQQPSERQFVFNGTIFRIDPDSWDLRIVARRIAKIYLLLWVHTPLDIQAGSRVQVKLIQKLFSYAYQLATSTSATYLRFYAFAIIHQLRFQQHAATGHVFLYHSTVAAISFLRMWSINALMHPQQFLVSIAIPTLLVPTVDESPLDLSLRQERLASRVIWSDACTDYQCIGVYIPNVAWATFTVTTSSRTYSINVLELLGMIMALSLDCYIFNAATATHIHRRSDSTVALAQSNNQTSDRPVSLALILYDQTLQARHKRILTQHHCPGIDNTITDVISRQFTPDDSDRVSTLLHQTCHKHIPNQEAWMQILDSASEFTSMPLSSLALLLRTLPDTKNMWSIAP